MNGKASLPEGLTGDITVTLKQGTTTRSTKTGASPFTYTLDRIMAWGDGGVYTLELASGSKYLSTRTPDFTKPMPDITQEERLVSAAYKWYVPTDNGGPMTVTTIK